MTEPSLLTAAIPMQEAAYRRYIASKPVAAFAEEAAGIIIDGREDYLLLRYLKNEGMLYLAFMFRWADRAEAIMERPCFAALLGASEFLSEEARGQIIISPGALNFLDDGAEAAFSVTAQGSQRNDAVTGAEMDRFDGLLNAYFFTTEPGSRTYLDAVKNPKVLDPKLRGKVEKLLDLHSRRVAKERLPDASPLRPVRLFDRYHYNGHFLIYVEPTAFQPIPGIDPYSLRQTRWGAADSTHAIVAGHAIATDPQRFKMHHGGESVTFYSDDHQVYAADLSVIANADPNSFEIVDAGFARDRMRWYAWDGSVLDDVGDTARIDKTLYFLKLCLLLGDRSIYMGTTKLPLDAASCQLKRLEKTPSGPTDGTAIAWLTDRQGDLIVSSLRGHRAEIQVQRTDAPESLWTEIHESALLPAPLSGFAQSGRALDEAASKKMEDAAERQAFITFFEAWLAAHFELYRSERPYDDQLWRGINNYFYCCWHMQEYQKIVTLYRCVELDAWRFPGVFHHTACCFCALGEPDRAMREIYRALSHGYDRIDALFADPDIGILASRDDFARLKDFREANRGMRHSFLSLELVLHLAESQPGRRDCAFLSILLGRYAVPSASRIASAYPEQPETARRYRAALAAVVDDVAVKFWRTGRFWGLHDLYKAAGDLPDLHPATHLIGALTCYKEGFFWIDMKADDQENRREFLDAARALQRMRKAVDASADIAHDAFWREVAESELAAPFLNMADSAVQEAADALAASASGDR